MIRTTMLQQQQLPLIVAGLDSGGVIPQPEQLHDRALPTAFALSALFRAAGTAFEEARPVVSDMTVASAPGWKITFTGQVLTQTDLLVLLFLTRRAAATHASREPTGKRSILTDEPIEFRFSDLVRELRWTLNGHSYDRAQRSLTRLTACAIRLVDTTRARRRKAELFSPIQRVQEQGGRDIGGSDDEAVERSCMRVWLDPRIASWFEDWVPFDWNKRVEMHRSQLAGWLYFYLCACEGNPIVLDIAEIRERCASGTESLPAFKQLVQSALRVLTNVGVVASFDAPRGTSITVFLAARRTIGGTGPATMPTIPVFRRNATM